MVCTHVSPFSTERPDGRKYEFPHGKCSLFYRTKNVARPIYS